MQLEKMVSSSPTFFAGAYRGRRVLVTGHTGFKGSWLCIWLLSLGAEVCGYSDGITTTPSLFVDARLETKLRHEIGDIRDISRISAVFESFNPEFVFHLAAQAIVSTSYLDPVNTISVNVLGTASVLEVLRLRDRPCTSVIITSDKAYDNVEWLWGYRETDRLGGKDIYSGSKGAAELIFKSYIQSFFSREDNKIRLVSARAGNVIGGGDWARDRIVADCIRSWSKGETVKIRSPRATRPWQHVLEPLSGYLTVGAKLAEKGLVHGESFNFGPKSDQNASVLDLLSALAEVWGFDKISDAYVITNDIPFHEASLLKLDIDKSKGLLHWQPTMSYRETVELTAGWYSDVVKNGADALSVTQEHIDRYASFAVERNQVWTL